MSARWSTIARRGPLRWEWIVGVKPSGTKRGITRTRRGAERARRRVERAS